MGRKARPAPRWAGALAVLLALILVEGSTGASRPHPNPAHGELLLDRDDPSVDAVVAGVPARLAVVPDTGLHLSAAFAARLPLDWQRGAALDVGRVAVPLREADATVAIGGGASTVQVTTADLPCCRGHDGSVGAADLPWAAVRIGRAGPEAGPEQRLRAEVRGDGLSLPWPVGRDTLHLVLAPDNPETIATASAAAILARAYGGHLLEPERRLPVLFGIERPVRDMVFDRPVPLLGFSVRTIAVRVADFAGAAGVLRAAEAEGAADAPPRPDEIVVRHRPPPAQYRWPGITVGRDLLGRCAEIALFPREEAVTLRCAPG